MGKTTLGYQQNTKSTKYRFLSLGACHDKIQPMTTLKNTTLSNDQLHRFVFDNTPIRGNTVRLQDTYKTALQHVDYPPLLRSISGGMQCSA